ncbi:MAG: hypothetical protein Q7W30_07230 [Coriobacteriia bacterium]|nr:hypothetical protein [Coriobacteriia bacterium]
MTGETKQVGFEESLRQARLLCASTSAIVPMLAAVTFVILSEPPATAPAEPAAELALFTFVTLFALIGGPYIREWLVRRVVGAHLAGADVGSPDTMPAGLSRESRVYTAFVTGALVGYGIGEVGALLGFVGTIMAGSPAPLAIGSAFTIVYWAFMWPRRNLWERWTWQAKLRRGNEAPS